MATNNGNDMVNGASTLLTLQESRSFHDKSISTNTVTHDMKGKKTESLDGFFTPFLNSDKADEGEGNGITRVNPTSMRLAVMEELTRVRERGITKQNSRGLISTECTSPLDSFHTFHKSQKSLKDDMKKHHIESMEYLHKYRNNEIKSRKSRSPSACLSNHNYAPITSPSSDENNEMRDLPERNNEKDDYTTDSPSQSSLDTSEDTHSSLRHGSNIFKLASKFDSPSGKKDVESKYDGIKMINPTTILAGFNCDKSNGEEKKETEDNELIASRSYVIERTKQEIASESMVKDFVVVGEDEGLVVEEESQMGNDDPATVTIDYSSAIDAENVKISEEAIICPSLSDEEHSDVVHEDECNNGIAITVVDVETSCNKDVNFYNKKETGSEEAKIEEDDSQKIDSSSRLLIPLLGKPHLPIQPKSPPKKTSLLLKERKVTNLKDLSLKDSQKPKKSPRISHKKYQKASTSISPRTSHKSSPKNSSNISPKISTKNTSKISSKISSSSDSSRSRQPRLSKPNGKSKHRLPNHTGFKVGKAVASRKKSYSAKTINSRKSESSNAQSHVKERYDLSAIYQKKGVKRRNQKRNISDSAMCTESWKPNVHGNLFGCDRCFGYATKKEQSDYHAKGHHYRIMMTRGGCSKNCKMFPASDSQNNVRLCQRCFHDTHMLKLW